MIENKQRGDPIFETLASEMHTGVTRDVAPRDTCKWGNHSQSNSVYYKDISTTRSLCMLNGAAPYNAELSYWLWMIYGGLLAGSGSISTYSHCVRSLL